MGAYAVRILVGGFIMPSIHLILPDVFAVILGFKRISLVFQHVRDRNRGAYDLDPRIPFLQGAYKIQHHAEFYARIEIDTGDPVSGQCLVKQAGLEADNPYKLEKDLADAEKHRVKAECYVLAWNIVKDKDGNIVDKSPRKYANKDLYDAEMKKYKSALKSIKRFNNRAIRWTRFERELFEETLEEFGYSVDRERMADAKHQTKKEHLEKMAILENQMNHERKKYEELRKNEEAIISERTQALVASIYERVKDEAKKDANKEKIAELVQIQTKVDKRKAELKNIEERRISILAQIDGNRGLIEMIRNRDKIIAQQEEQIKKNEQRMSDQFSIRSAVAGVPEEKASRFDELNRMLTV